MTYQPPFTISSHAVSLVAEIAALVERYVIHQKQRDTLKLRRANRIKTIHSTLAIEGNLLSLKQMTDILEGKRVIAPLREIQEVKNAIATYDLAPTLDPFSVKDLLKAHQTLMTALVDKAGIFRSGNVGVFAEKKVIHVAPPASLVQKLIENLFDWLQHSNDHLLIKSCVFHSESGASLPTLGHEPVSSPSTKHGAKHHVQQPYFTPA